jgi:hypothetical protein
VRSEDFTPTEHDRAEARRLIARCADDVELRYAVALGYIDACLSDLCLFDLTGEVDPRTIARARAMRDASQEGTK